MPELRFAARAIVCVSCVVLAAACRVAPTETGRPAAGGSSGKSELASTTTPQEVGGARGETTKSAAVLAVAVAEARPACPDEMASIDGSYCIDRYEASLVEITSYGEEREFSPFATIGNRRVRAVSRAQVYPQGYISAIQAARACETSGKRLCKPEEWQRACRGPENKKYGYADQRQVGRCNDNGKNPVVRLFGFRYDATTMNHPRLNQLHGTLIKTGERDGCSNGYGVYDMVGNLHEWVADPKGTFYGGYYQDVASVGHGDGCSYQTKAHGARYHDYSTGFRCCADISGAEPPPPSESRKKPASVKRKAKPKKVKAKPKAKDQPKVKAKPKKRHR